MKPVRHIILRLMLAVALLWGWTALPSLADFAFGSGKDVTVAAACHCDHGCSQGDLCGGTNACMAMCNGQLAALITTAPSVAGGSRTVAIEAIKVATPIDRPPPLPPPNIRL